MTQANEGDIVVVTGGAKGIGRAIALLLADRGYDVAVLDPLPQGEATAREVEARGRRAIYLAVDVADEAAVNGSVARVEEALGTPNVLVNNAGIFVRAPSLEMSYADFQRNLNVNLGGAFLCSRAYAPGMFRRGGGQIINIASGRGLEGTPNGVAYAASKAGIISLTRTLALEWAPSIRVNTVVPGVTDTDQPRAASTVEELYARGSQIPLGRIGQPEDIARGVALLLSPDAGYVTGQALCVNGGAITH
jgi:NAD(P)-dependent dehydrogenase (short-subunit alcohol dehydrogenase family)